MEKVDCVVIGTGLYGLSAAKQYHHFNPSDTLVVLERDSSVGGTWSDERLYPGVKANNLLGGYQYPDFPMTPENTKYPVKPRTHIPGAAINQYFKSYAEEFGIAKLIRFNTSVKVARHLDGPEGGWELTTVNSTTGAETKLYTRRLIVGTGQTSEAFLPHFEGQETFGGEIFHGKDWPKHADTLETCKTITVFGGSKFAWDAVYQYAKAGVKVNWVIRSSGHGPNWISSTWVTPLKRWIEELANTRFLTFMSPCIWGSSDGYTGIRSFLHGTAFGRLLVNGFWAILGADVIASNPYNKSPDAKKLKPWTHVMFTGPSYSILTYEDDIFELIKSDLVTVYIDEIERLSLGKVHLSSGTELDSDALLAHTGWKHVPAIKFLPEGIDAELGIPHPPGRTSPVDLAAQEELVRRADEDILSQLPRLKDQPVWNRNYVPLHKQKGIDTADEDAPSKTLTPYMLYHFILPASERFLKTRDIAFTGVVSSFSNPINSHIIGMWISAFFDQQLTNDPGAAVGDKETLERVQYETVLHNRFGKWRYPTDWGNSRPPSFIFDAVPYLDLLQRDLGLKPHRKGNWLKEMWSPYLPPDYRTINEEWEESQKKSI